MIKTITLIDGVLVLCQDSYGGQCIAYQGQFNKVIDKIKKDIDISQIEWVLNDNNKNKIVSFDEWLNRGISSPVQELQHRKINDSLIHQQTLRI